MKNKPNGNMKQPPDSRWKYQPFYVKAYRWIRYRPPQVVCFFFWMVIWGLTGFRPIKYGDDFQIDRGKVPEHFWIMIKSKADFDMGKWLTSEEWLDELRKSSTKPTNPINRNSV